MDSMLSILAGVRRQGRDRQASLAEEKPPLDDSEKILVSPLALLKMLKHCASGVPFEVMGLLLGTIVDDFTIKIVDVFSFPQKATSVSVETVDELFQKEMMDLMSETGRKESAVGWYHSHPSMGPFLSSTDVEMHRTFMKLNNRFVAIVVDTVQSRRGSVLMDAFRTLDDNLLFQVVMGNQTIANCGRSTTSNLGTLHQATPIARLYGLGMLYYGLPLVMNANENEQAMLRQLRRRDWAEGLKLVDYGKHSMLNQQTLIQMGRLTKEYEKGVLDEVKYADEPDKLQLKYVGKEDPKRHLACAVEELLHRNIGQILGASIAATICKANTGSTHFKP